MLSVERVFSPRARSRDPSHDPSLPVDLGPARRRQGRCDPYPVAGQHTWRGTIARHAPSFWAASVRCRGIEGPSPLAMILEPSWVAWARSPLGGPNRTTAAGPRPRLRTFASAIDTALRLAARLPPHAPSQWSHGHTRESSRSRLRRSWRITGWRRGLIVRGGGHHRVQDLERSSVLSRWSPKPIAETRRWRRSWILLDGRWRKDAGTNLLDLHVVAKLARLRDRERSHSGEERCPSPLAARLLPSLHDGVPGLVDRWRSSSAGITLPPSDRALGHIEPLCDLTLSEVRRVRS